MDPNNSQQDNGEAMKKLETDLQNLEQKSEVPQPQSASVVTTIDQSNPPIPTVPSVVPAETSVPTPVSPKKSLRLMIVAIILAVIAVVAVVTYVIGMKYFPSKSNQTACTLEAKICPDGTSVGRTGPNCEFAECPTMVITPSASSQSITP